MTGVRSKRQMAGKLNSRKLNNRTWSGRPGGQWREVLGDYFGPIEYYSFSANAGQIEIDPQACGTGGGGGLSGQNSHEIPRCGPMLLEYHCPDTCDRFGPNFAPIAVLRGEIPRTLEEPVNVSDD